MNIYSAPTADFTPVDNENATYQPSMFQLKGRIGRVRYLGYYCAWVILLTVVGGLALALLPNNIFVGIIAYLPVLAAIVIVAVRRLNDMDHSGWLAILIFIPLINILVGLWLLFSRGTDGPNTYGPPPSANTRSDVLLAWIIPAIAIIGILASVAIPAYSDYTKRANAARGAALATPVQVAAHSAPLSLMSM